MLPDLQPIIIGIGAGLLVAAPIGPVNILAIHRTIERGVLGGLAVGIGAAIADGLLGLAAAFGVTAISGFMLNHRLSIQSMGALVLVIFGLRLRRRGVLGLKTIAGWSRKRWRLRSEIPARCWACSRSSAARVPPSTAWGICRSLPVRGLGRDRQPCLVDGLKRRDRPKRARH